jgi:hypothetical protein
MTIRLGLICFLHLTNSAMYCIAHENRSLMAWWGRCVGFKPLENFTPAVTRCCRLSIILSNNRSIASRFQNVDELRYVSIARLLRRRIEAGSSGGWENTRPFGLRYLIRVWLFLRILACTPGSNSCVPHTNRSQEPNRIGRASNAAWFLCWNRHRWVGNGENNQKAQNSKIGPRGYTRWVCIG